MSDHDEFDSQLAELFRREHTHLPAEPFTTATLKTMAAERRRAALRSRALQAAAVILLVLASPRLLEGSVWVSARLDELFVQASGWLATPLGMIAAVLGGVVALATKWARIW